MSCVRLVLSKSHSEISYLPSIHVFQQWDSFCSQKLSMPINLSSWSTFCSCSFTYPVLLNSFLWSTSPWLFRNTQLFLLCPYLFLWYRTWGFSFPSPSSFCLCLPFWTCFTNNIFLTNSSFFFLQFNPFATTRRLLSNFCDA